MSKHNGMLTILGLTLVASGAATALAAGYLEHYEGIGYPENQGWVRTADPGVQRTLQNGWLIVELPAGTADAYSKQRFPFDPGAGELFYVQWHTQLDTTPGDLALVYLASERLMVFGVKLTASTISDESHHTASFAPGVPHYFELRSLDMLTFSVWVDDVHAFDGPAGLVLETDPAVAGWESLAPVQPSVARWDYFRFAVGTRGDMNCDGVIDFADITPFVQALSDPAGYARQYDGCSAGLADCNGVGAVNFDDINPFVELLTG